MAGAYSAVVSVMTVMDNLKLHPYPPITLHPQQAESLTQHLTFLEEFLEKYDQTLPYSTEADPLESRIADAAYAAEDAIESHIVDRIKGDGDGSDGSLYEALEKVIQEMALIQKAIQEMAIEINHTMAVGIQHQSMPLYSLRSSSVAEKSSMVGVDDVLLELKDKLVSDRRDRQIIPIVGMGGTGKTSLAINVYHDPLIKEHFHMRAWATISQEYDIREILLEVLTGLSIEGDKYLSVDKLGEKLYRHLFGRKYLIVMDDMWSIGAWDGIRRFLPDNKSNSRIVITTRLSNLASELPNSNKLEMKLLDETNSWDLLSKTVFGGEGCPPELEEIGKKIGKSCKGLPLSIAVVGGFMAKSERTKEFWKYIEENLSIIANLEDYERCLEILHMSYKHLPIYLKPCFLYIGVFPEDNEIEISPLVKMWVAEGFLKPISGESTLEEIARVYLKDLADRNLILIHEMGISGNIKRCKIHDLLRDLCLREAEKERFYTLTRQGMVHGQRRIVISNTASKNEVINVSLSASPVPVRSLFLFCNLRREELPTPASLRLLRIFHDRPIYGYAEYVIQFFNSRFLQLKCNPEKLEFLSSIRKFWNLQTVIGGFKVNVPTDIWYMPHIRHLLFPYGINVPDPPKDKDDIVLGNLQTLVRARNFKCSYQLVKRIPNIKKLKIRHEGESIDEGCLTNLNRLEKLESLACDFYFGMNSSGTVSLSSQTNFPDSLKKLCLRIGVSEYWEQDLLDKIGSLPFLQKLKLQYGRFEDGKWETKEGQFCSLKFLSLSCCENLQVWTIESSHFPCLSHLRLDYAVDILEEFPLDLAEVSTLRLIEVWDCTDSSVVSLKRILEENEELNGDADLHVQIKLWRSMEETPKSKTALEGLTGPNFRIKWIKILEKRQDLE